MTPRQLIEALGRDEVAKKLGSTSESVRVRISGGELLPPRWFAACEEIAIAKGHECPRECFAFARTDGAVA